MTTPVAPRRRPRRSRRSRVLTILGLVLILGGLSFLGYVGWQYYGTNIVSKHKQAEVKKALVQDWDAGTVDGEVIEGDAIGLLRVERFGADYEMPIIKGFGDGVLARGVGMNPEGADPGQVGNFAIAAHRVTHGEPFRDFLKLRTGDLVVVETRTDIYTYELRGDGDKITVDFTTGWPLQRVPDPDARGERPTKAMLTMLTCSELFHTRNRNVVIGDLVSTVPKTAPGKAATG